MKLSIFSETAPLEAVITHRPGDEVDQMPPALMEELLFDDILHGPSARAEHDAFTSVIEAFGVTNFDFQTLLGEAVAVDEARTSTLVDAIVASEHLTPRIEGRLRERDAASLAKTLIAGLPAPADSMSSGRFFDLPPLPNALMARDPALVVGNGVIISAMKRGARAREAILNRFVHDVHPELAGNERLLDFHEDGGDLRFGQLSLEGGDVLVLEEGVLAVGVSERTMEASIDVLAESLRKQEAFKTLIMVRMPGSRSQMHLDTVFTRIAPDQCLVYPPMLNEGYAETLSVVSIDLTSGKNDHGRRHPSFFQACRAAGVDLEPIPCGGDDDYIHQTREQWTDGANSFCLAPGKIILYQRNQRTLDALDKRGYQVIYASQFLKDAERYVKGDRRVVVAIESAELSRARGGPRCMTMPLVRRARS